MFDSLFSPRQQREFAIAAQAQRIALEYFPTGRVEPEAIAQREGIEFRYASFPEEFDGILLHEAGRFFIVCNDRRAPRGSPRSRFTFAHELGHYFLSDHREVLASGKMPAHFSIAEFVSRLPVERESDLFAANLLMPYPSFCREAAGSPPGLERVARLADIFGTSVTAAAFRALDADLFPAPAAVFRWDLHGKPGGRRMSWETFHLNSDYRVMTQSAPEGSATAAAIQEVAPGRNSAPSDCVGWFSNLLSADHPRNLPLREVVMSLGQFGYLTVVYRNASRGAPAPG